MNILSYKPEELREILVSLGEPKFRAEQIFTQLHKGLSLDEMTKSASRRAKSFMLLLIAD